MPESRESANFDCLLVDDDEIVLEIGAKMLQALGYCTLEARNGLEAVDLFRRHSNEVKLVIMDMQMPIMDGESACYALKKINPEVMVILASGISESSLVQSLLDQGFDGFIRKPFNFRVLSENVEKIIDNSS